MNKGSIFATSTLLVWLGVGCLGARAQVGATGKLELEKKRGKDQTYKPVNSAKTATATASTSALVVVAEPGAQIFLEAGTKQKRNNKVKCNAEAGSRACTFNGLKPGFYQVSVELEGYEDVEGTGGEKSVRLVSNKSMTVEFKLRPITYNVKLKTNVKTGQVLYRVPGGNQLVQSIQTGGALLRNLPAGTYEVELSTNEVGYQTRKQTLEISAEQLEFDLPLERRVSDATLSANWASLDSWDAPPGWRTAANKLVAKGLGVALPRSDHFRHYADFELVTDVKMENAVAASFAVRARDKRNYYLIQITGAQADRKYVLRGFVVKDGVAKPFPADPINVNAHDTMLANGQFFELTILGVGSKFVVYLGDSQSGIPLGGLEDPDNTFPIGAPGIAVREQEQQEIARLIVKPLKK